ncbi:hypothetical protein [Brumimicrobium mesophilum]|uniref:hypothetical protein n=1 Tax=Brumimicrobium mesophilum TaxID=392717 RepID=UPI000D13F13E|nr:hypothetical protein [Brumimicrobium mesophilum]
MNVKIIILFLIGLVTFGCNSIEREMTEVEQYLANKYDAERLSIDFTTLQSQTNGEMMEDRKFINIEIINPIDIEKIMSDIEYSNNLGVAITSFVLDSVQFDTIPFQPKEIQVDFINESGFLIFNSENRKTINLELN